MPLLPAAPSRVAPSASASRPRSGPSSTPATTAASSPKEQAALKFAEKLTRESRNIGDADIAALKAHFTEEQIVDLDMLVGLANLTNRLTDPLGADLEFPEEKIPA